MSFPQALWAMSTLLLLKALSGKVIPKAVNVFPFITFVFTQATFVKGDLIDGKPFITFVLT
jgi:hypothetical protein